MADVAARAGVSRALVSIVFRGAPGASPRPANGSCAAAEELAYRPDQRARLLGSNRSRTFGVVFGLHHEFHAGWSSLYRATRRPATSWPSARLAHPGETRAIQSLLDYRCEALVLIGPTLPRAEIEQLASGARGRGRPGPAHPPSTSSAPTTSPGHGWRSSTSSVSATSDRACRRPAGAGSGGAPKGLSRCHEGGRTHRPVPGGLTDEDGERAARSCSARPPPSPRSTIAVPPD